MRQVNYAEEIVRSFLFENNFIEIRTPLLWEPIKEYGQLELEVVHPEFHSSMFSLLQSPLAPSLLTAIGGLERTFQFSRCFRWETEGDDNTKSLEFTQLHLTMAFTSLKEGKDFTEKLISHLINNLKGGDYLTDFPSISFDEAIMKYGHDRPDFRYSEILTPIIHSDEIISPHLEHSYFQGILVESSLPEPVINAMHESLVKYFERIGIMTLTDEILKEYGEIRLKNFKSFITRLGVKKTATLFVLQSRRDLSKSLIQAICRQLIKYLNKPVKEIGIGWVENFPYLFKLNELNDNELKYLKHFSRGLFGRTYLNDDNEMYVRNHDLIYNGIEIASGGEKEHDSIKFLENLLIAYNGSNLNLEEYRYHIEALQNGAPNLYTIAFGWERLLSQIFNIDSIYDLMIFPKDGAGRCQTVISNQKMESHLSK